MTLKEYLKKHFNDHRIELYFDIETYQYNERAGSEQPSKYKNMTFSVAVSYMENGTVGYEIYPNFKDFFDDVIEVFRNERKPPRILLNAHNTNKYDNHFLRRDLLYYYPQMTVENYYLTTAATPKSNENSYKLKDLTKKGKEGVILEKRVKSKINLELVFFIDGIQFETVDNFVKTHSSIATLGNKLKRLGVVTDDELKTDFDYLKYNLQEDLTEEEAREYASNIFKQLNDSELKYIRNDVILLAKSVYYYSDMFNHFSYSKPTFTSNILESYNTNLLTSFQLLNRFKYDKSNYEVRYTDYHFANENFYDYLKPFYRGGLNFYNQNYVGRIIDTGVFSMDIHSSYPYAMHNFKIPTYLHDYKEYESVEYIPVSFDDDNYYSLYRMTKQDFDNYILDNIDSMILRQILVKYYSTNDYININSYTLKMLNNIIGFKINRLPVLSYLTFECKYFGSREQIEEFYRIKTQGKYSKRLHYNSPYDMYLTSEDNKEVYTQEEVDISKVNLNGLYGIPALRPYFNLFRRDLMGDYYNVENGHKNAERNIVFSIFVTSVSLWNLLNPLKYLTEQEIDDNFLYCDTDSLYFKTDVKHKLPKSLFTEFNLGTWGLELENAKYFYILNHKKYSYQNENEEIQVRSGGVSHNAFNRDMSFKEFIDTQFSDGKEIKMNKSIFNEDETISIYPSTTRLEVGKGYRMRSNSVTYDRLKEQIFKAAKEQIDEFSDDALYIESVIGTFSISDVFPVEHESDKKRDLAYLQLKQDKIRKIIDKE